MGYRLSLCHKWGISQNPKKKKKVIQRLEIE